MPCAGHPSDICGGSWRLSVYSIGKTKSIREQSCMIKLLRGKLEEMLYTFISSDIKVGNHQHFMHYLNV